MLMARTTILPIFALGIGLTAGAAAGAELTIVGTGDGLPMLRALGAAFSQANPAVKISVPDSIGSSGGIKAVGTGEHPMGRIARDINDKEKGYNLTAVPIAKLPVAFFVHKDVKVASLDSRQLVDIFSGSVGNWKEVGGPDLRIRVVRREDGDSSLSALQRQLAGFKGVAITARSKTATSTAENIEAIAANEGAIGFGPYDAKLEQRLGVVRLDGKAPLDAGYPVFVTLSLIFKSDSNVAEIPPFVDFVKSPAAHRLIRDAGAVPF